MTTMPTPQERRRTFWTNVALVILTAAEATYLAAVVTYLSAR